MRLIIVGCEYAGKTTLSEEIIKWTNRTMGGGRSFHDHFTIPNPELAPEVREEFLNIHPQIKEQYQRFILAHHLSAAFYKGSDHNLVGYHIEEAVYAPLYYGYGGKDTKVPGRAPAGQRTIWAREIEKEILQIAPDTALILMKADPDVIAKRMTEAPHEYNTIKPEQIELLLRRFQEEFDATLLDNRFVLDTTKATVDETLGEFVENIEPMLTDSDRMRIAAHQLLLGAK